MRTLLSAWLFYVAAASQLRLRSRSLQGVLGALSGPLSVPSQSATEVTPSGSALLQRSSSEGLSLLASARCDLVSTGDVCYGGGGGQSHVLAPPALPGALQARYTFDEPIPLDSSGMNLHATESVPFGPSPAGNGHSASFSGNVLIIPNSEGLPSSDFTYSMWLYLAVDSMHRLDRSSPAWCPLLRKGTIHQEAQVYSSAPGLEFQPQTGLIRGLVTTSAADTAAGEYVESNARLSRN
eukprot:5729888-Amphidinium_carterae.1